MELKKKDLTRSVGALQELSNMEFGIRLSYSISKTMRKIMLKAQLVQKVVNEFYGTVTTKEEKTGKLTLIKGKEKEWETYVEGINEEIVDTSNLRELKLSEFGDTKIKPHVLDSLDWLIKEDK